MPVVDVTQPIVISPTPAPTPTPTPTPVPVKGFAARHLTFVNKVKAKRTCFRKEDITGFEPDELNEHLAVAIQDNMILQDVDRFCSDQTIWRMRERTKGYVYERV